ncbi:hypothetical protein UI93_20010, partial [Salmonella enterica subsp. arizonae]|nr:hypothetical protein [Salmonella enterica subsp. arizonae]
NYQIIPDIRKDDYLYFDTFIYIATPQVVLTLAKNQYSAKSEIFVFLKTPDKFRRSHVISR